MTRRRALPRWRSSRSIRTATTAWRRSDRGPLQPGAPRLHARVRWAQREASRGQASCRARSTSAAARCRRTATATATRLSCLSTRRRLSERADEALRGGVTEVLRQQQRAAALLVLEKLEREVFPPRARDDLKVQRADLVVRRFRRALRRIDVRRIAEVVHSEVADVALRARHAVLFAEVAAAVLERKGLDRPALLVFEVEVVRVDLAAGILAALLHGQIDQAQHLLAQHLEAALARSLRFVEARRADGHPRLVVLAWRRRGPEAGDGDGDVRLRLAVERLQWLHHAPAPAIAALVAAVGIARGATAHARFECDADQEAVQVRLRLRVVERHQLGHQRADRLALGGLVLDELRIDAAVLHQVPGDHAKEELVVRVALFAGTRQRRHVLDDRAQPEHREHRLLRVHRLIDDAQLGQRLVDARSERDDLPALRIAERGLVELR